MAKLLIEVNCGEDTCGKCEFMRSGTSYMEGGQLTGGGSCGLFRKNLSEGHGRLPECVGAEVKKGG